MFYRRDDSRQSPHSASPTVMKRLFRSLAVLVGIWLLGSFLGVMFDPARANMWTQSLMWALLSCVILAPVFLFVGTASESSSFSSSATDQPFEVDQEMGVAEDGNHEEEEWPYTSEQDKANPGESGAMTQNS